MSGKHGDFEEFALARTPALYRAAWLLCGEHHRSEDLVQETLAKIFVRWRRRLRGPIDNPAGYAHTTTNPPYGRKGRRNPHAERGRPV